MTFARRTPTDREAEKEARRAALLTGARGLHRGTYAGGVVASAPKPVPRRCPTLLDMARDRPCLLLVPGICNHRTDTTVAAHSNLAIHGKAGARKADDCYSVWACAACHAWLDQGPAPADAKERAFTLGHINQVQAWRVMASDSAEPYRNRRAALDALKHLEARPA